MLTIDAFTFCRDGDQQTGKLRLSKLPRLRAECASDEGDLEWSLQGTMSGQVPGYPALKLSVKGSVQLTCQRCLASYLFCIQSTSSILLAKDEQAADQLESLLQEDEQSLQEIIVGSKTLDVIELIEDEALLALPLSPRHEICPEEVKLKTSSHQKKASPFAVLKGQVAVK